MLRGPQRWLVMSFVVAVAAAASVVGLSSASVRSSRTAGVRSGSSSAEVIKAHVQGGDELLAGPVLLDDRYAVWAEAGPHRLLVRSLDVFGRTRTIFSTSRASGVPKGAQWPFIVTDLAAGAGRVALVVQTQPCGSSPARNPRCPEYPHPATPMDSSIVLAGRPGSIHAVDSVTHRCGRALEPWRVAVSADGLVVDEEHDICPGRYVDGQLVLRSFTGQLVRVLSTAGGRCTGCISSLRAAGHWVAYIVQPNGRSHFDPTVQDVRTGRIRVQLIRSSAGDMAIDGSGNYATLVPGPRQPCQAAKHGPDFAQLDAGRVGHGGVKVLASRVDWNSSGSTPGIEIAQRHVAFVLPTGHCLTRRQLVTAPEGGAPRPVPGIRPDASSYLAFDGHLLAVAQDNAIELTATDCAGPAVPVPAHEPAYHPGPTELASGIYNVGGPAVLPPCKPEPHGPVPGKITITNQRGEIVATRHVRAGHLAHIPLAAGEYTVQARIGPGPANQTPARMFTVRSGETVRQDSFEPVP